MLPKRAVRRRVPDYSNVSHEELAALPWHNIIAGKHNELVGVSLTDAYGCRFELRLRNSQLERIDLHDSAGGRQCSPHYRPSWCTACYSIHAPDS